MKWKKGVKIKKRKVTARDIQLNMLKIKEKMDETDLGTEQYDALQAELDKEMVILKKYKDSKFMISPEKILTISVVGMVGIFFIALERENPKALKFASFLLKLFPMHF